MHFKILDARNFHKSFLLLAKFRDRKGIDETIERKRAYSLIIRKTMDRGFGSEFIPLYCVFLQCRKHSDYLRSINFALMKKVVPFYLTISFHH